MIFKINCTGDCSIAAKAYPALKDIVSGMIHCNNESSPFYKMIGKIVEIRTGNDKYDVYDNDNDIELIVDFDMDMSDDTADLIIKTLKSKGVYVGERSELRQVAISHNMVEDILFGLIPDNI